MLTNYDHTTIFGLLSRDNDLDGAIRYAVSCVLDDLIRDAERFADYDANKD